MLTADFLFFVVFLIIFFVFQINEKLWFHFTYHAKTSYFLIYFNIYFFLFIAIFLAN